MLVRTARWIVPARPAPRARDPPATVSRTQVQQLLLLLLLLGVGPAARELCREVLVGLAPRAEAADRGSDRDHTERARLRAQLSAVQELNQWVWLAPALRVPASTAVGRQRRGARTGAVRKVCSRADGPAVGAERRERVRLADCAPLDRGEVRRCVLRAQKREGERAARVAVRDLRVAGEGREGRERGDHSLLNRLVGWHDIRAVVREGGQELYERLWRGLHRWKRCGVEA